MVQGIKKEAEILVSEREREKRKGQPEKRDWGEGSNSQDK